MSAPQRVDRSECRRTAPRPLGLAALAGFAAAAALAVAYARKVEPWYQAWGATDDELAMSLPIDDLVTPGCERSTRAITVESSADDLWSWLIQIGLDRAGFYSYTTLENLVGARMRNASEIVPEWQHRSTGDTVWLADEHRWHDQGKQIAGPRTAATGTGAGHARRLATIASGRTRTCGMGLLHRTHRR